MKKGKQAPAPLVPENYDRVPYGTKNVQLPSGRVIPVWYESESDTPRLFTDAGFHFDDKISFEDRRWQVVGFNGSYAGDGLVCGVYLKPLQGGGRIELRNIGEMQGHFGVIPANDVTGMIPVHEFAARWGISEKDVRKLLRAGELTGVKDGKEWLVDTDGVEIEVSR